MIGQNFSLELMLYIFKSKFTVRAIVTAQAFAVFSLLKLTWHHALLHELRDVKSSFCFTIKILNKP